MLSNQECINIINFTEEIGYVRTSLYTDRRGIEHYNTNTRKSEQCIIDDERFIGKLLKRIKHCIPPTYQGKEFHSINERVRFLKYDGEGHFKRHADGKYTDEDNGIESMITVLLYFNEDYEGAFTTFYGNKNDKVQLPA